MAVLGMWYHVQLQCRQFHYRLHTVSFCQGNQLSGKPGNVREFTAVREMWGNLPEVREVSRNNIVVENVIAKVAFGAVLVSNVAGHFVLPVLRILLHIKAMWLHMEVDLSPGDVVLDGVPAPPPPKTGCLTLLEIYWKFTKSPGYFLIYFASFHICHWY